MFTSVVRSSSERRRRFAERVARLMVPGSLRAWAWDVVVRSDRPLVTRAYLALHPEFRWIRLTRATALVIDGHSRCANTYAVYAFEQANGSTVRLTHHLHSAWVFERARLLGTPALLLIRKPADAVASMVRVKPGAPGVSVIEGYTRF
jgi:transposase InsO family protein